MKKYLIKYSLLLVLYVMNLPQVIIMLLCHLLSWIGEGAYKVYEFILNYCLWGERILIIWQRNNREILDSKVNGGDVK